MSFRWSERENTLELANYLPTKFTKIFAMLTNFHLLDLLSQTSPISGTYKEMNMQFRKFSHKGNCKFEKYKCIFYSQASIRGEEKLWIFQIVIFLTGNAGKTRHCKLSGHILLSRNLPRSLKVYKTRRKREKNWVCCRNYTSNNLQLEDYINRPWL